MQLNYTNHNSNGNPHSQYDINRDFIMSSSMGNPDGGYGYVKVAEFVLANDIAEFEVKDKYNVIRSLYLDFDMYDLSSESNTWSTNIQGWFHVTTNQKDKPMIQAVLKPSNLFNYSGARYINCKIGASVNDGHTSKDGVVSYVISVYISTFSYGLIGVVPNKVVPLLTAYTSDPWGALNDKHSTLKQRFSAIYTPMDSVITESALNSMYSNENSFLVSAVKFLPGSNLVIIDEGTDLNTLSALMGNNTVYSCYGKHVINSPFGDGTYFMLEVFSPIQSMFRQRITNMDTDTVKERTFMNNKFTEWK